jgi:hypothetical protein
MPTWNEMEAKRYHQRRQAALDQLDRDREIEADRLASEQNPPKPYDGSLCRVIDDEHSQWHWIMAANQHCPLGTLHCVLKHDASDPISPGQLEANAKAWDESKRRKHFTGD